MSNVPIQLRGLRMEEEHAFRRTVRDSLTGMGEEAETAALLY